MLETVRLFHPDTEPGDGMLRSAAGLALYGPVAPPPGLARRAGLEGDWRAAYVATGGAPALPGLAHRLGGRWLRDGRAQRGRDADHLTATVYLPARPGPTELAALLVRHGGPVHDRPEGIDTYAGVAHSPVATAGLEVYATARFTALVREARARPHALGPLRDRPALVGCELAGAAADGHGSAREIAAAALAVAENCAGVALDCDGYRITGPEDLLPGTASTAPAVRPPRGP
ncbi:hypothetical protein DPM19_14430 [Actinomadura craniellae]|uniref:Uncharacterized protein n=1 Tax=Actinomadura craniellae TaxID=2231787 RepID=A0A365H7A6_9ACTN|nr:hypothetical protein [Actinomadura craniellae]RAY14898.1 hypothetical protein DPM19_14430 [Actinomadura craniellae]